MTDLDAAATFIWTNARLLDRHRFAHLFMGEDPEPVMRTLRAYRNADGGFGHAIEPDLRGPVSQPIGVYTALDIVAEVGATDDPLIEPAGDFLAGIARPDGGVPFVLPTASDYPRAPWWQPGDESSSLTMTAANAAALYAVGSEHSWLDGASEYCWRRIDALDFVDSAYDTRFAIAFLDAVPDEDRATAALDRLGPALEESGLVTTDPDAPGEVHQPLDFSPWPGSRSRRLFADDLMERHVDALAARQEQDGGWTVNFPGWSPAGSIEWRGVMTVLALRILRAHDRL
jgi:hypothetical protein